MYIDGTHQPSYKKYQSMKLHFFVPFLQLLRKILLSVKLRGWGRLIFNSQLLQIKYSDLVFNLLKVCIDNGCYVSVSSVGVFFSNLFRFNEMGCIK